MTNEPPKVVPADWLGWVWPVPVRDGRIPTISDGFSAVKTSNHRAHPGVDITYRKLPTDPPGKVKYDATTHFISPKGTPVLAAGPGRVWSAGVDDFGHWVLIDHGIVGQAGGVTTRYAHLEKFAKPWKKGDIVQAGTELGLMGYSPKNDSEQFRHLHFELKFPRKGVHPLMWNHNPVPYMRYWRKIGRMEHLV